MRTPDIAKIVSEKTNITHKKALEVIGVAFDTIAENMTKEDVVITGFGAFGTIEKARRTNALNPRTKEKVIIPKRNAIVFRLSNKIKKPKK